MVAAKDKEVLGIFDLICQEKTNRLQGLLASIYVITEEEIVGFRRESTVFEKT